MRSAVVILSLVAAIAAEAPYNLPRPAPQAPSFNYPSAPPPSPPPQRPIQQFAPQPTPQPFNPGSGYQYQQPSIAPVFAPQQQYPQQYQQQYQQPQPQYIPQPQPQYQQPQPQYIPQPQTQPQPISYNQPQAYQPPSTSYGIPQQPQFFRGPSFQPTQQQLPQLAPQPSQFYQPSAYNQQQFSSQSGYSYQQPQLQQQLQPQFQPQFQPQHIAQVPLQSQHLSQSSPLLSSYQADLNQYSNDVTHREALDSVVVDRVQNIIRDSEHTSARDAGYQSLVSGVSLENAKPSIEITSFVHSSPLIGGQNSTPRGFSRNVSAGASAPSSDYGLPSVSSSSRSSSLNTSFLPQPKPATSYGPPN